jgi:hypothetical protein
LVLHNPGTANFTQGDSIMKQTEPPPRSSSLVFIGRNSRGNWVAQEQNGLFGGLFINRAEAFRYALFENGHHPEAIMAAPSTLELDMTTSPAPRDLIESQESHPDHDSFRLRRAA